MRDEYDFSTGRPNPYARKLKQQITIRLDVDTVAFFKRRATETGLPYQSLINLYLADCATQDKQLQLQWVWGHHAA